jgi:hypothetical protein
MNQPCASNTYQDASQTASASLQFVFIVSFSRLHACEIYLFSSGCSEMLKVFPSGSLNQATFAPVGEIQMPSSS